MVDAGFFAYFSDVNIDCPFTDNHIIVPNLRHDFVAGKDLVWPRSEEVKKFELFTGELDFFRLAVQNIIFVVYLQIAGFIDVR